MSSAARQRHAWAAMIAAALVVTACSGGDDSAPDPTVAPTTTQAPAPRESDGILRIGALVPGTDTRVGTSITEVLENARRGINAAGGVLDRDIEIVVRDEGATTATATAAIASLHDEDVDAIIGPASSITALGALDDALAAGTLTCSATASAIALDDFPDFDQLFFRTIASDSLQAVAIAELAEDTGESEVAIVHVDDAYGRPYAEAVQNALEALQLDVVTTIPIAVDDDAIDDEVSLLLQGGARVAVVLAGAADTVRYLDAIGRQEFRVLNDVIVNDAVRDPVARPLVSSLPSALRSRITGVAPQITVRDDEDVSGPVFEPQVTDCMNMIALAAVEAESDLPNLIAQQMPSVSAGGSVCTSFAECADELALNRQIDYRGLTGVAELNRQGETSLARFEAFKFDDDGNTFVTRPFTVVL